METKQNRNLLLLLFLLFALSGCKEFTFFGVLGDQIDDTPLLISPATVTIPMSGTLAFTATGGKPPYSFALVAGTGTIDAGTGVYTAPATAGKERVQVTDTKGRRSDATINVTTESGPLAISPNPVSMGPGGSLTFIATGGVGSPPTYTFTLVSSASGATLNLPLPGDYTAGPNIGSDVIELSDGVSTVTATVNVTAAVTNVDYTISATGFPAMGTGGNSIPIGAQFTIRNNGSAAGTKPVSWSVYISADATLGSGDLMLASGGTAALGPGATVDVTLAGTWPAESGSRWLFAMVAAGDDLNPGNNTSAGSAMTLNPPDVDYTVTTVNHVSGTVAGGSLTANFTLRNNGTSNGTQQVYWTAYSSTNNVLDAGDPVLGTGNLNGLAAGGNQAGIAFTGTWPATAGSYYLIVEVAASDDINAGNNNTSTTAPVVTSMPPVDYTVTVVNNTGPTTAAGPVTGDFSLRNSGSSNGSQLVFWVAYASPNNTIDAGDPIIASGSTAALNAGATQSGIPFSGTWPPLGGTYYLIVRVSAGDDLNPGNNSTASGAVAVASPNVDYRVTVVNNTGATVAGGALSGNFTVQNNGTSNGVLNVYWTAYVSTDATLDAGDTVLDSGSTAALGAGASQAGIGFVGTWPSSPGFWYLIVKVSADDEPAPNTGNNWTASGAVAIVSPNVDYRVTVVNNTGATVAGGPIAGSFTLNNTGTAGGAQLVHWIAHVSTNATLDAGDPVIDSGDTPALAAGGTQAGIAFDGTWPSASGSYYLIVEVSAGDEPAPNAGNNSTASAQVTTTQPPIDYTVTVVANTGGMYAGGPLSGAFTLRNGGTAGGYQNVYWTAYVSTDNALDAGDTVIDAGVTAALAGGGLQGGITFDGVWPAAPGTWYLIVKVSADDEPAPNTGNNWTASPQVTTTQPPIDYTVVVVNSTGGSLAGGPLAGNFTLQNVGTAGGSQNVYWTAYVSTDAVQDIADPVVDSGVTGALAAGGIQAGIAIDGFWPATANTYYLIVKVTAEDEPPPSLINNWKASGAVAVTSSNVDYIITIVNNTGPVAAGGPLAGNFTVKNSGTTNGSQNVYWEVYASFNNSVLDAGDTVIVSGNLGGPLNAGAISVVPFAGTWPYTTGPHYLIASVSAADDVASGNNTGASGQIILNPPNVDYTVTAVSYTGASPAAPATAATGNFQFKNNGANNGSQSVGWMAYASLDIFLDGSDFLIASGNTTQLAAGATSAVIPINGSWPLVYGNYYLLVWVGSAEDINPANNTNSTGATTAVGIYQAIVQNGNCTNLTNYTDLTGVVLKPGMSAMVVSTGFPSTHTDHLFRLNTGTASTVTASWVLDNAGASEEIGIFFYKPPGSPFIDGYWIAGMRSITLTFLIDAPNVFRWIDLYSNKNKNLGSYKLYITAN